MTTYTGLNGVAINCSEANAAWWTWSDELFAALSDRGLSMPGICLLEQQVVKSHKDKVCAQCGDPGEVEHGSILIKCVPTYWLCEECNQ